METYTIRRTGKRPLEFVGETLFESSSKNNSDDVRWYEAALYRSKGGRYVLSGALITTWKNEASAWEAWVEDSESKAAERIEEYDPMMFVPGFPPKEAFAHKQALLKEKLRQQWLMLVAEFFETAGLVETID